MARFINPIPSFPHTLVARAERLAILAHALNAFELPPGPGSPPPAPRQPTQDSNENRFHTVHDANRELYNAEYVAFLQQTKDFKTELDEWALTIVNDCKNLAGSPPTSAIPAMAATPTSSTLGQQRPALAKSADD